MICCMHVVHWPLKWNKFGQNALFSSLFLFSAKLNQPKNKLRVAAIEIGLFDEQTNSSTCCRESKIHQDKCCSNGKRCTHSICILWHFIRAEESILEKHFRWQCGIWCSFEMSQRNMFELCAIVCVWVSETLRIWVNEMHSIYYV